VVRHQLMKDGSSLRDGYGEGGLVVFSSYRNILYLALEVSVTPIARIHLVFGSVVIIVPCMLQFRPMR
jgi:hypothetical protein